jgi:hypothetical protein
MAAVLTVGEASAALAASVFHFGEIRIPEAKAELLARGVPVRPPAEAGPAAPRGAGAEAGEAHGEPAVRPAAARSRGVR